MLKFNETQIYNDVTDVLDRWDVKWQDYGVDKLISSWSTKKEWLINILRRHPNWNERAMGVVFTTEEERVFDKVTFIEELKYLTKYIEGEYTLNTTKLTEIYNKYNWKYSYAKDGSDYLRHVYYAFVQVEDISSKASEELIISLKGKPLDPDVTKNFKPGMKTSRIINALLEPVYNHNNPEVMRYYNQHFAKCADALNPMKVIKYTILSVHPADFLNMSYGTGWESCHALDDGCYRAGSLSYINDNCSMILYTVSNTYDGEEFFKQRKINRQIYCLGKDYRLLQSRLYPQNESDDTSASDNFRSNVQAILSICLDIPNLWIKSGKLPKDFFISGTGNKAYPDWYYPESWYVNVSYPKNTALNEYPTHIGGIAHCLVCGDEVCSEDSLYCGEHSGSLVCSHCGAIINEEYDNYEYIDDEIRCDDCYFYCTIHNEYEPIEDMSDEMENVCQEGYDEAYRTCEYCGSVIDITYDDYAVINGYFLCEEHFTCCSHCGDVLPINEVVSRYVDTDYYEDEDGNPVCEACYKDLIKDDEELQFTA